VPSSQIGRFFNFGGLAVGIAAGALAEVTRRTFTPTKVFEKLLYTAEHLLVALIHV